MGFGHRLYRRHDPRAIILKDLAAQVFAETTPSPLLEVAQELERIALEDDFFVQRKLYPNVDFYSGIILDAIGLPAASSPYCLRSHAPRVGCAVLVKCSMTPISASLAPAKSTRENPNANMLPSRIDDGKHALQCRRQR